MMVIPAVEDVALRDVALRCVARGCRVRHLCALYSTDDGSGDFVPEREFGLGCESFAPMAGDDELDVRQAKLALRGMRFDD